MNLRLILLGKILEMPSFTKQFLFIALLFLSFKSFSGTIKGNVSDKTSGEPLVGAIIMLQGTPYGTSTGLDGSFVIPNVPAGAYDLQIMYTSFQTYKEHITITQDQVITINNLLPPISSTLNEVEIKGTLKNGSDEQARNIEKNSDNLLNIVSARTIELLPDITVANVLQRVSGVQMERDANGEARYALIRGMDKRYNYTEVDGIKIPSPDDKMRYVPLDIFPAELLDRIEVIKSLTPDMEGDAIGGVTNLVMKNAPDHFVIYATAATGYNENLFDQHYSSFDKGSIVSYDPEKLYGSGFQATPNNFNLNSSVLSHIQAAPNDLFSLSIGNRFLKNKKLGVMFSGSYQNTFKETNNLFFQPASQPAPYNVPSFDDIILRKYYTQEARTGLHANVDYKFNDKNKITFNGLFVQLNQWEERNTIDTSISGVNRSGPGYGKVDYSDRTAFRQDQIGNVSLKGEHIVAEGLKIDWTGAYSVATRSVPDMTDVHSSATLGVDPITGGHAPDSTVLSSVTKSWEKTQDQFSQGFVNITYKPSFINNVELKAGGMYSSQDRVNYYNEYDFAPTNNTLLFTGPQNINIPALIIQSSDSGSAYANPLTYHVHENIYAYYAQAKVNLMDDKLEVLGGVRIEHTHSNDSIDVSNTESNGVAGIYDYTDVLPSLHLKYKLSSKENLRLSYFESISRPGFFELTNYQFAGEEFNEYGNPYLNHSVAQNIDARYEWFPKGLDQVLLGAFYKDIFNPIEYSLERLTGPSAQQIQPVNLPGKGATNYGAEILITKYFHYFGISANYTYTHSAVTESLSYLGVNDSNGRPETFIMKNTRPLQGQAEHIGNLALIYKNPVLGLDAHLTMQYTGRHIALLTEWAGLEYWQKGTTVLAFSVEKRIVKHLSAYAKVNNLLNTPTIVELSYPYSKYKSASLPAEYLPYQNLSDGNILVEKSTYGRNYLVGLRYKFD